MNTEAKDLQKIRINAVQPLWEGNGYAWVSVKHQ